MSHIASQSAPTQNAQDFLPLRRVHHIEFIVGNAKQSAYFYHKAFGFDIHAYKGPETGHKGQSSYLLSQGQIRIVLTTALSSTHKYAKHHAKHGDGVYRIAFEVENAEASLQAVLERGATLYQKVHTMEDEHGSVEEGSIAVYGDTIHSFIATDNYTGCFLPGYKERNIKGETVGVKAIDHMVANVELGAMNTWVDFYANTMGFSQLLHFDDKDISTEYSALMSKVMQDGTGKIKLPINEPADGKRKSQIEEYLEFYDGPGIQHIALITGDIIDTVSKLKENGVDFLHVPTTYYDDLQARVGEIKEDIAALKELGILVDRDDEGYLLQLFTKPVEDRPTLFFEIIQRRGSRGFGKGNFKALFEAIEREQEKRGNL